MGAYDALSQKVRDNLRRRKADLEILLDRQITAAEYAQNALIEEMAAGEHAKGKTLLRDTVQKLQAVGGTLEVAARTRIALAKAEKLLAGRMTTEETLAAAKKFIMALTYADRGVLLTEMVEGHLAEYARVGEVGQFGADTALKQLMKALEHRGNPAGI